MYRVAQLQRRAPNRYRRFGKGQAFGICGRLSTPTGIPALLHPQQSHMRRRVAFEEGEKLPFCLAVFSRRFCTIEDPIHEQRRAGQARPGGGRGRIEAAIKRRCTTPTTRETLSVPHTPPDGALDNAVLMYVNVCMYAPTVGHLLFPDCGVGELRKVNPTHMRRVI